MSPSSSRTDVVSEVTPPAARAAALVPGAAAGPAATGAAATALRRAALELFAERGFHGTSMRDIAARAGCSVSHVYYYFPSKGDVLRVMMVGIVEDLLADLDAALAGAGAEPRARLVAIVRAQVLFHCRRQAEAFVGRSELRSLAPGDRPEVIGRYDRVTAIFRDTIAEGEGAGVFRCAFVAQATHALVTMCNAVSAWWRPDGELSPERLAERYAALALAMLGAPDPPGTREG